MKGHFLQNSFLISKNYQIIFLFTIAVLVGMIIPIFSQISLHHFLIIMVTTAGFYALLLFFIRAKIYTVFQSLPGIVLIIFLVPGSINLSVLTGLRGMKNTFGIDLNGIRLALFCFIAVALLIITGRLSKAFKIYLIFLLFCFGSLFYSSDLLEGIRFFSKLLVPLLIYLLARSVSFLNFKKLNQTIIYVVLLHIPFVFLTLFGWFKEASGKGDILRASGLSGGRVIFGTFMVFVLILFYFRSFILQKEPGRKSYVMILLAVLSIILSGARIAWVGLIISFIVLGIFKKFKNLVLIGIIALLLIAFFRPLLQQRIGLETVDGGLAFKGAGAGTVRHRILIWEWLFREKIPNDIFWGHGLGSSKKILSELPKAGIPALDYPHNEYIRLLLETGIIGVFLFLYSYFYIIFNFLKKFKNISYILPILTYLIFCLADNTLNNYFENGAMFAYLMAYLEKGFANKRAVPDLKEY